MIKKMEPRSFYTRPFRKPVISNIDRKGWEALGIGLGITLMVLVIRFLSFVFHYIIILLHELGHTIFGWLFGYPSIPAFDFTYGGGITIHQQQNPVILVIIFGGLICLFYIFRKNIRTLTILVILTGLYLLLAFSSLHELLILFMGHGTELFFGGLFLFRALSGSAVIVPAERPLYAFLAFFVFIKDFKFAYNLIHSPTHREIYRAAKGGGDWMDFSRIAREFLHADLTTVSGFFLGLCVLTPVLAYLFFRYQDQITAAFKSCLDPEP